MKYQLPKSLKDFRGFTLVELLVVIAIIAILAVVGAAILTSTQSRARDTKRKGDIDAMSSAMEANYTPGTGYATSLSSAWFADQVIPSNPQPGPTGTAYFTNTITTAGFTFCAALENSTGNATGSTGAGMGATTGSYFCRKNTQ